MAPDKNLRVAYRSAGLLLVVGVLCYAAFSPPSPPREPIRVMYDTAAGKVLFDHKVHLGVDGYGIACSDCHHHPQDETGQLACQKCHTKPENLEAARETCMECHEADEFDMESVLSRTDAFHDQCIGCHKDFEAGPEACSSCHVL